MADKNTKGNISTLYNLCKANGYDFGTQEQFAKDLTNEQNRRTVHQIMMNSNFDIPTEFSSFEKDLGFAEDAKKHALEEAEVAKKETEKQNYILGLANSKDAVTAKAKGAPQVLSHDFIGDIVKNQGVSPAVAELMVNHVNAPEGTSAPAYQSYNEIPDDLKEKLGNQYDRDVADNESRQAFNAIWDNAERAYNEKGKNYKKEEDDYVKSQLNIAEQMYGRDSIPEERRKAGYAGAQEQYDRYHDFDTPEFEKRMRDEFRSGVVMQLRAPEVDAKMEKLFPVMDSEINEGLKKSYGKAEAYDKEHPLQSSIAGLGNSRFDLIANQSSVSTVGELDNVNNYMAASNLMKQTKDLFKADRKYDNQKNGVGAMLQGVGHKASDPEFWSTMISIRNSMALRTTLKKVQDIAGNFNNLDDEEVARKIDEELTDSEKTLLRAYQLNSEAMQAYTELIRPAYKAGQVTAESLKYAGEFALGSGLTSQIGAKATNGLMKWFLKKGVGSAKSKLVNTLAKGTAKVISKEVGAIAQGVVQTAISPSNKAHIFQNMTQLGKDGKLVGFLEATANAGLDDLVENSTEFGFGPFSKVFGAGEKAITKALANHNWTKSLNLSKGVKEALEKMGIGSFFEEYGEEVNNAIINWATGRDPNALRDFATSENQLILLASFAPMIMGGAAISGAQRASANNNFNKWQTKATEAMKDAGYTDEQIAILNSVVSAKNAQQTIQASNNILSQMELENPGNKELLKTVGKFIQATARKNAIDGAKYQEITQQREALSQEISDGIGGDGRFWQNTQQGQMEQTPVTEVIDSKGGVSYVTNVDENGLMTLVDASGNKSFMTEQAKQEGLEKGTITVNEFDSKDEYLESKLLEKDKSEDTRRMQAEMKGKMFDLHNSIQVGATLNLGTFESPNIGTVSAVLDDSVTFIMDDGTSINKPLKEVGQLLGKDMTVRTQEELDKAEAERKSEMEDIMDQQNERIENATEFEYEGNTYLFGSVQNVKEEDGELRAKVYALDSNGKYVSIWMPMSEVDNIQGKEIQADSLETNAETEPIATEEQQTADGTPVDSEGNPLPTRTTEDGKVEVDQNALWNRSVIEWARYRSKTFEESVEAIKYMTKAKIKLQGETDELKKQLDNETDFDKIADLDKQIKANEQRLADMVVASDELAQKWVNKIQEHIGTKTNEVKTRVYTIKNAMQFIDDIVADFNAEKVAHPELAKEINIKIARTYREGKQLQDALNKREESRNSNDGMMALRGVEISGQVAIFADDHYGFNTVDEVLHHELQHAYNAKTNIVQEFIKAFSADYENEKDVLDGMKTILRNMTGTFFYDKYGTDVLADEIIANIFGEVNGRGYDLERILMEDSYNEGVKQLILNEYERQKNYSESTSGIDDNASRTERASSESNDETQGAESGVESGQGRGIDESSDRQPQGKEVKAEPATRVDAEIDASFEGKPGLVKNDEGEDTTRFLVSEEKAEENTQEEERELPQFHSNVEVYSTIGTKEQTYLRFSISKDKRNKILNGVSTFSGAGTLELGLEGVVDVKTAVEYDPNIATVYAMNHNGKILVEDATKVDIKDNNVQYYHASPVCTRFSKSNTTASKGEAELDIASANAIAKHIKQLSPQVVTIENVSAYKDSKSAEIIRQALRDNGYTFDEGVYKASDFGGSTSRSRFIMRAVKDGELPTPTKSKHTSWYDRLKDIIDDMPETSLDKANYVTNELERRGIDINNLKEPIMISGTTLLGRPEVRMADDVGVALTTRNNTVRILMPDGRVLRLTNRGKARLMGYPDSFKLPSNNDLAAKVIGNGIPYELTKNVIAPAIELQSNTNSEQEEIDNELLVANGGARFSVTHNPPLNGVFEERYPDGSLMSRSNYKNGQHDGLHEYWHENGFLKERKTYKNDKPDGLHEWWNNNGQLISREFYKDGEPVIIPEAKLEALSKEAEAESKRLEQKGYDGLISTEDGEIVEYAAFNPNQIKLADAVTYDDNGEVIPLSKRFDENNDDIRFSVTPESKQSTARHEVRGAIDNVAKALKVEANHVTPEEMPEGFKDAPGYYKDGKVYICEQNCLDVEDAIRTVLHEVVGHKGLRAVVGAANMTDFCMGLFKSLPQTIKSDILRVAPRHGMKIEEAVEEYIAEKAEAFDPENKADELWTNVKSAMRGLLRKMGLDLDMNNTDIKYLLWQSYNANKRGDALTTAKRIALASRLGLSAHLHEERLFAQDEARMRRRKLDFDNMTADQIYNSGVNLWSERLKESFVDQFQSLESLYKAIEKASGKVAKTFEDIRITLNQLSSKNLQASEMWQRDFYKPLLAEVSKICKDNGLEVSDVDRYLKLKHGLERNKVLAARDAKKYYRDIVNKEIDEINDQLEATRKEIYADKTLSTKKRDEKYNEAVVKADALRLAQEDIYKAYVSEIENETNEKYLELRQKDYSGISSMFVDNSDWVETHNEADFATHEDYLREFNKVVKNTYKDIDTVELAAEMEVEVFEDRLADKGKALWDKVRACNASVLQMQKKSGLLSPELVDKLNDMFMFYVPLRGFEKEEAGDLYDYYGDNVMRATPVMKKAKGRSSEADSPLAQMGYMASMGIAQSGKNEAKQALYYFIMNRLGSQSVATVGDQWYLFTGTMRQGKKVFEKAYFDATNIQPKDFAEKYNEWLDGMHKLRDQGNAFNRTQKHADIDYVISDKNTLTQHAIKVNILGQEKVIYINGNPRAAQAVNGLLNIEATNSTAWNVISSINRWLAAINTSYHASFWLSNFQRDLLFATMSHDIQGGKASFGKNLLRAKNTLSLMRQRRNGKEGNDKLSKAYKEFADNGGITGFTAIMKADEWKKMLEREIKDSGKRHALRSALDFYMDLGESFEQITRFATYLTSRENGKTIAESVADAKNVTVNFNRKGSGQMISWEDSARLTDKNGNKLNTLERASVVGISSLSPAGRSLFIFFNAAVQGLNTFFKLVGKNPKRMAVWMTSYATIGFLQCIVHDMLLDSAGGDGDDDKKHDSYLWKLNSFKRRTNLLLGDDNYYLVWALPQECRAFYALGDVLYNHMVGRTHSESFASEAAQYFIDLSPINPDGVRGLVPTLLLPFYDVWQNENFMGSPIAKLNKFESKNVEKMEPQYDKVYNGTSEVAKAISKALSYVTGGDETTGGWLNVNPAYMEHVVQGYVGGLGTMLMNTGKLVASPVTGEKPEVRNVPILSRLLVVPDETTRSAYVNQEYYYFQDLSKHIKNRYKTYLHSDAPDAMDKADELMNSKDYKAMQIFNSYQNRLTRVKRVLKKLNQEVVETKDKNELTEIQTQIDSYNADMEEIKMSMIDEINKAYRDNKKPKGNKDKEKD